VGKLADYPPMNCDKIFEAVPGPLDHHGCPFKTEPPHVLTKILASKGLSPFGQFHYGQFPKTTMKVTIVIFVLLYEGENYFLIYLIYNLFPEP
jgi:hypothetical protein